MTTDNNQTVTGVHDSATCKCEFCAWTNQTAALDRADLLTEVKQHGQYASLATVRCAVADVLDTYPPANVGSRASWQFWPGDESETETLTRVAFIDAVTQRVAQLQAPPHNFDAGLRKSVEKERRDDEATA
jgi:hypothetical protein